MAVQAFINCIGVRSGAAMSSVLAIAKLLPLVLLIALGLGHSVAHPVFIHVTDISGPGWGVWFTALLTMLFAYGGWEDALVPSGEVKEVRRNLPFALAAGLFVASMIYALLQYVTVATIGTTATDHPLADLASLLLGDTGRAFVSLAAMLSTYGSIAAIFVNAPRLPYALAVEGDGPPFLATLHPRFNTPVYAIVGFAIAGGTLALSGTFLWVLALSAGSMAILYMGICASLLRLRHTQSGTDALRIPFGQLLAMVGIALCATLLAQLDARHALLMLLTASLAAANWLGASYQMRRGRWKAIEAI
jgi:amino acid transporter